MAFVRVQELCESRGGRPGLPVPNRPYYGLWTQSNIKRMTFEMIDIGQASGRHFNAGFHRT